MPAAAGRDHRLGQLECVERAAESGLRVGDDRGQPVGGVRVALRGGDLVGAQQGVVDAPDDLRNGVDGVETLVGVGVPGLVGVGGDLPAGQIDGLEPGPDLLHGLAAGQGAERVDVVPLVQLPPQTLRAAPGQGVLLTDAAGEPYDVLRAVGALDALPAGIGGPAPRELLGRSRLGLCHGLHRLPRWSGLPIPDVTERGSGTACLIRKCGSPPVAERSRARLPWGRHRCRDLRRQGMNRARFWVPTAEGPAGRTGTLALALSANNRGRMPTSVNLRERFCQVCEGGDERISRTLTAVRSNGGARWARPTRGRG